MSALDGTAATIDELVVALNEIQTLLGAEQSSIDTARGELLARLGATTDPQILRVTQATTSSIRSLAETADHLRSAVASARAFAAELGLPAVHLQSSDTLATFDGTIGHATTRAVPGDARQFSVEGTHTCDVITGTASVLAHNTGCWSTSVMRAGDLAGKYRQGQSTRDPTSQWYHEELGDEDLLNSINNAEDGDGIVVTRNGTILGGHHPWDELQTRIHDRRIDSNARIYIQTYGGE